LFPDTCNCGAVAAPDEVGVGVGVGVGDEDGEVVGLGDGLGEAVLPPLQAVPFSVKAVGAVLVPL
jgi:hypothetical protein